MKVLFYGESPTIETGLAQVAKKHIEVFILLKWEIEAVCINHMSDDYDMERYPFTIHKSPENDSYNRENMRRLILKGNYDIIFFSCDVQNVKEYDEQILYMRGQKSFKVVTYTPIDCDIINAEAFSGVVNADMAVTATFHAESIFSKTIPNKHIEVIYHGCEADLFYPLDSKERVELRKNILGIDDNVFVVLFVGRNQQRKDFARGMYGFHLFHNQVKNSACYMHSKQNDNGGSLPFYAKIFDMDFTSDNREIYFTSPDYNEAIGIDRSLMNRVYNLADVYCSSSTGEGWGLCTTEAMAAEVPVLVPNNTSHIEIVGGQEDRGYLIKCGGDDLWHMPYGFTANPRDNISCSSMVNKLGHIYYNPEEAEDKAKDAREWTKFWTWEKFRDRWINILTPLERSMADV